MKKSYFEIARELLDKIEKTQLERIKEAAKIVAETISQNGLIYIFGTGHSHMLAEEIYYRAGGLVPVKPILIPSLMLHEGAILGTYLERQEGVGRIIAMLTNFKKEDTLFVISNSGVNPVPVEMAIEAKNRGVKVISILSLSYSQSSSPKSSTGKKLYEVSDIYIDNCGVIGDAILEIEGLSTPICPTSTLTGVIILQSIVEHTVYELLKMGKEVEIFQSSKLPGSDTYNLSLIKKYSDRINF